MKRQLIPLCLALSTMSAIGIDAHAGALPRADEQIDKALTAMQNASTLGHPDLFGEFAGMERYARRDYAGALRSFKYAARYADKLSQLSIGLMYDNGEGVAKDPVTACAWLALAAERKFPSFTATRDRVCKALTPAQHEQAVAVLDTLMPDYGDAVAKPRMAMAMQLAMMNQTGSRLGFDTGVITVGVGLIDGTHGGGSLACGGPRPVIAGVVLPRVGCGSKDYYDPLLRDPKKYFAARDAQMRGTVTVGEVRDTASPPAGTTRSATPAAASSSG
ncbi:MAG TPA: sel1 repeat family protein [Rhodanobacteraceae bacterium]|nr:sel1 repeat family protein [Rhodanobacteraceae bacterium]